jgi:hypothetical protein
VLCRLSSLLSVLHDQPIVRQGKYEERKKEKKRGKKAWEMPGFIYSKAEFTAGGAAENLPPFPFRKLSQELGSL